MVSLLLLLLELFSVLQLTASSSSPAIAKSNCQDQCGNLKIPYPFGITADCYYNKSYEITCDTSFNPPKAFLYKFKMEVMDIYWSGRNPRLVYDEVDSNQILLVKTSLQKGCRSNASIDFRGSPYFYSTGSNVLVMEGCGGRAIWRDESGDVLTGCASICVKNSVDMGCFGFGCCQASLNMEQNLEFYQLEVEHDTEYSGCDMRVGIIDSRTVKGFGSKSVIPVQTVLDWYCPSPYVENVTGVLQVGYPANYSCDGLKSCSCSFPYEGNPYLPYGCQVMRECRKCRHRCIYDHNRYHCGKSPLLKWGSVLGFSLGMGSIVLLVGCYWLYKVIKRKREVKRKLEYFKRNGGLLLQQQIGTTESAAQKTKVFPVTELEKATNNFNKNRILGQGGQGTVYKGMLKDGKIVAIKKSKKVDESQLEQFVNEVVILSQINHRNVVRLLGCCLDTEVPLLVYEFVPNGTLYQHIHDASEDFHVTWKMRLQMAAESADAIAYLHSSSSTPVYHRDIKSSNILLDAKFRAKVSDFGTSKAINIEQSHVTTCVMGTYGYLDPEYFQSNQFTGKSDVYSFGVVLVELITGKKPICPTKGGGWISLAVEFLLHMENSRLSDILDARILEEGTEEEFVAVAVLASQCLKMKGKERPCMKEVTIRLDDIRSSGFPSSSEQNMMEDKGVMMGKQTDSSSMNTFFSDVGPAATVSSIEAQQSVAHTL